MAGVFAGIESLSPNQFAWRPQACNTVCHVMASSSPLLLPTIEVCTSVCTHAVSLSLGLHLVPLNCLLFSQPLFFLHRTQQLKQTINTNPKTAADVACLVTRDHPENTDKRYVIYNKISNRIPRSCSPQQTDSTKAYYCHSLYSIMIISSLSHID